MVSRTERHRCITRVEVEEPKRTVGWNVRVIRRGIAITEFFADAKHGGTTKALRKAIRFRDRTTKDLQPYSRLELARRKTARNTSGIPGVRRRIKPAKKPDGNVVEYIVWTASATPLPGQRQTRDFYVSKLGEDDAREAAIAQRLRWERQMEIHDKKRTPKK